MDGCIHQLRPGRLAQRGPALVSGDGRALVRGPAPLATKTLNALGCEGQSLATQVNAYTINPTGNITNCDLSQDDGIGGSPMESLAFQDYNISLDITSLYGGTCVS